MKNLFLLLLTVVLISSSCNHRPDAVSGATKGYETNGNSFYHKTDETSLKVGDLIVEGEVQNPGKVNLENIYKREVFYKQSIPVDSTNVNFIGAYRYRGYSLFDLLNGFIVQKKNVETFRPLTDLYIIIENEKGENVTFSWAEIYLTVIPHQIIIATEAAPIEPYKREVAYPVGGNWKIIAASDLFAYRELDNPVKITVKSFDKKEFVINRNLDDSFSPKVDVTINDELFLTIDTLFQSDLQLEYKSVFYGMGMGYHPEPVFKGLELMPLIGQQMTMVSKDWIRKGLVCFVGFDGYRVVYSYSELFNRVDQVKPILAIPEKKSKSGYFRIYHPISFYADMSAKNLAEIYIFKD
ncbi:MAG: hypothetical protein CVT92_15690 [Bacteroidetes bacterium HGW-Bacteroidetes-1]|jgi:hypothetical protein|nr:MAG: hypothetical protein CVT92_15690 [Bacteroidetes bacterium HGW-Bacteroidetes-1]